MVAALRRQRHEQRVALHSPFRQQTKCKTVHQFCESRTSETHMGWS
jgi:hypothetical protein